MITLPTSRASHPTHALLIGVDHYDSFDGQGLLGSRNDVVLLAWYCLEVLGVPAENIHVLTSPPLSNADFAHTDARHVRQAPVLGHLGTAVESEVNAQIAWLLDATKGDGSTAVLSFSGHGSWSRAKGPILCLEDTAPGFDSGIVALRGLGETIRAADARSRVVAVLDCCHVTGPVTDDRLSVTALPHEGTEDDVASGAADFDISDRVVLGARPGKKAHQVRLGTHRRGALTYALVTAAERWHASRGMSLGSYKQVLKRAKDVVRSLGVPQTAKMLVPAARWQEIRKAPFLGVSPGPTAKRPDRAGRGTQLDPNFYILTLFVPMPSDGRVHQITLAVVVAIQSSAFWVKLGALSSVNLAASNANKECWYVNASALQYLGTATKLVLEGYPLSTENSSTNPQDLGPDVAGGSTTTSAPLFTSAEVVTWSSSAASYSGGTNHYFTGTPDSYGYNVWLQLNVGSSSLNGVQWYTNRFTSSYPIGSVDPAIHSTYKLASSSAPTPPTTYFSATSK